MEIYGMNRNSLEEGVPRPPSGRACAKALWQEQMAHRGQVRVERPLGLKQEGLMISPRL